MPDAQLGSVSGLQKVGSTGLPGFTLINGSINIFSWTPPNDGNMHRVAIFSSLTVTSAETGGKIAVNFNDPSNTAQSRQLYGPGLGIGYNNPSSGSPLLVPVYPGVPVVLVQATALTVGAAQLWAEMWGS